MTGTRPTRADTERPSGARRGSVVRELAATVARLERSEAHLAERVRSLAILLERAEADRDTALRRLSTCFAENDRTRHLLLEARETIARLEGAGPPAGRTP